MPAHGTVLGRAVPFISRVRLKNYRSIAECDVRLGPLTILAGPAGSGKSSFLDALAFLARSLEASPGEAIEERGGVADIMGRVPAEPEGMTVEIEARLGHGHTVRYLVAIGNGGEVTRESCARLSAQSPAAGFTALRGRVICGDEDFDVIDVGPRRLLLPIARQFAPLAGQLGAMRFYHLDTETLREPHQSGYGLPILGRSGEDIGDVLDVLGREQPRIRDRINAYLRAVAPDADGVEPVVAGDCSALAPAMSDEAVRAAGVLAALFQPAAMYGDIPLVAIEGPEAGLPPPALFDALTEASANVQVVAATRSAGLLHRDDSGGPTFIGEPGQSSRLGYEVCMVMVCR